MAKRDDLTLVGILGVIIVSKCWGSHVGSTRVLHNHFAGFEAITDGFGNQLNQIHTFARLASLKKDERERDTRLQRASKCKLDLTLI